MVPKGLDMYKKAGILLTVLALTTMGCIENMFIYFPEQYPQGYWEAGGHLPKEDCLFTASDGVRLHGWWFEAKNSSGSKSLLWLHGNAGNITHRIDNLTRLFHLGVNIFIIDYRGYGKSRGQPSEEGLYKDAQAAYDYLIKNKGILPQNIYIFGRSLGGAVAVELALKNPCGGLIIESTFTSLPDIGKQLYPYLPVKILTKERYDSLSKIKQINVPKLIIHGDADEIVYFEHAEKLFKAAGQAKDFYQIKGADHNNTYLVGGRTYLDKLKEFVNRSNRGNSITPN